MASATAEYMALFRALESAGAADTRLFNDPFATRFLRPSLGHVVRLSHWRLGRALVQSALDHLWPGARASGVARTRLIDDALVDASCDEMLEQVVFLGAGFDCRAHRQLLGRATTFFEVDRPETQEQKRLRLGDVADSEVRYVPCDFESDSLATCLEKAGFDLGRRSFFLWEGVTNYLNPTAVDEVLHYVSSSAAGNVLLFTYVDRLVLEEPERFVGSRRLRSMLRGSDESWTFGLDPCELADFLERRGLRLVCDRGSVDYRAQYLGPCGAHLRGYEFYRAAVAMVGDNPIVLAEGASRCPK